jgi:hypothetical protein
MLPLSKETLYIGRLFKNPSWVVESKPTIFEFNGFIITIKFRKLSVFFLHVIKMVSVRKDCFIMKQKVKSYIFVVLAAGIDPIQWRDAEC